MLYLLPNLLGETADYALLLPRGVDLVVAELDGIIAESAKAARAYLKHFKLKKPLQEMPVLLLNEHTKESDGLLDGAKMGEVWGYVSDAGLPALADPGAELVRLARKLDIPVRTLPGPSSIIMALQLSGFSGQQFTFHGYLAREQEVRKKELLRMQEDAYTHIFIETPYRSHTMLQELISSLKPETKLSVSWDLTLPMEGSKTGSVKWWRGETLPDLQKKPAVFLIG
jgi:16S rRNA (cytidine1402-2'-O)-methyltransferase